MRTLSRLVGATVATVLVGGVAASASAAVLSNLHFEDSGSEPFTFCEGIDAEVSWNDSVHELVKSRGRDGLVYFSANVQGTTVYTNLDTGKTYSNTYNITDRDQQVTDNGDGTLTITIAQPGSNKWFDSDGTAALRHRRHLLVPDHGRRRRHPDRPVGRRGDRGVLRQRQGRRNQRDRGP